MKSSCTDVTLELEIKFTGDVGSQVTEIKEISSFDKLESTLTIFKILADASLASSGSIFKVTVRGKKVA